MWPIRVTWYHSITQCITFFHLPITSGAWQFQLIGKYSMRTVHTIFIFMVFFFFPKSKRLWSKPIYLFALLHAPVQKSCMVTDSSIHPPPWKQVNWRSRLERVQTPRLTAYYNCLIKNRCLVFHLLEENLSSIKLRDLKVLDKIKAIHFYIAT